MAEAQDLEYTMLSGASEIQRIFNTSTLGHRGKGWQASVVT